MSLPRMVSHRIRIKWRAWCGFLRHPTLANCGNSYVGSVTTGISSRTWPLSRARPTTSKSGDVLAFPNFGDAISGVRKFRVITDASTDGLSGGVIEQDQPDGTTRPLCFLSRTYLPNERNWTSTELECGALVWAVEKNRQLYYGIRFEVVTNHQPLLNLESLASKVICNICMLSTETAELPSMAVSVCILVRPGERVA